MNGFRFNPCSNRCVDDGRTQVIPDLKDSIELYALSFLSDSATTSGKKGVTSPPLRITSRTSVDATEVYCGRQVRNTVSM